MARVSDGERETLRQAADSANSMLPKLRQQADELAQRIVSLESIVKAYELMNPGRKQKAESDQGSQVTTPKKRSPKGQVAMHVDSVLSDGAEMDERAVRDKIEQQFGLRYGRPTVYTALRRGFKQHRYVKNGTKWKLNPLIAIKTA